MKESPRPVVLLLGGGPLGTYALKQLVTKDVPLRAVVPRRKDVIGSSFIEVARDLRVPALSTTADDWSRVRRHVLRGPVDYLLSVQYDRIVPLSILDCVTRASLNLHLAPLPRLRGCFPTKWAIIEGKGSGVTIHHMDSGIDTGNIVLRADVPIRETETDESLYRTLVHVARSLVDRTIEMIQHDEVPAGAPQSDSESSYNPRELPGGGVIDWRKGFTQIDRFVRAFTFPPYAGAIIHRAAPEIQVRAPVMVVQRSGLKLPGRFEFRGDCLMVRCADRTAGFTNLVIDGRSVAPGEFQERVNALDTIELGT